jgi:hypothetical protein
VGEEDGGAHRMDPFMSDASETSAATASAGTLARRFGCADIRRYIGSEPTGRSMGGENVDSLHHPLGLSNEYGLRECLTRAVADLIWHDRGGPDVLNWWKPSTSWTACWSPITVNTGDEKQESRGCLHPCDGIKRR